MLQKLSEINFTNSESEIYTFTIVFFDNMLYYNLNCHNMTVYLYFAQKSDEVIMYISGFAVSCNLMLFLALIFLLFIMKTNPLFDKKQSGLFLVAIIINLIALTAISMDYTYSVSGVASDYVFRRFTSFLNFALSPVVPFLLYQIFHRGKAKKLFYLPIALNFILSFLSMWTKIIFEISERNTYGRGVLFYLPIATSVFYIIFIIARPASSHAQKKKKERMFLFGVIGVIVLSMFLEIRFGLFFLSWNASAMCTILYYLLLNIHSFSLDALTGVLNRATYNQALDKLRTGSGSIIAMIDINNFKDINDNFGHDAGDECLIRFAKILSHSFSKTANVYRIGGDEFVLISKTTSVSKFDNCLALAKKEAANSQIDFACGKSVYMPEDNLSEILSKIDMEMYKNKASMKGSELSEIAKSGPSLLQEPTMMI